MEGAGGTRHPCMGTRRHGSVKGCHGGHGARDPVADGSTHEALAPNRTEELTAFARTRVGPSTRACAGPARHHMCSMASGTWTHPCLRSSYTEATGGGNAGSANAPTGTAIIPGMASTSK